MDVNEILDLMDEMLDSALSVPLSGGKCMVNADRLHDLIGDIRLNLPQEIRQSKAVVNDRKAILDDAKREAEKIVRVAEERARRMTEESEVIRRVKERANEIMQTSQEQSKELKRAANDFAENILKTTEQGLLDSLNQVKSAKAALRTPVSVKKSSKQEP
ncbi:MAG: ATPase [Massiliimalia sp.]|jgi:DNA anti-recombination protein RmuC